MEEQVKLPDMGEGVESATVVGILVEVGQQVEQDQGVIELETDKAVVEVPCPKPGKVKEIHVEPDQEVEEGTLLLTLEVGEGGEEKEQAPKKQQPKGGKPKPSKKKEKKQEPREQEEAPEEEKAGAEAKEAAEAEPEEEKKKPEAPREKLEPPEEGQAEEERQPPEEPPRGETDRTGLTGIPAAPYTRRLARELGVDLRRVQGSGEGGWITEADVKAATRKAAREEPEGQTDKWGPVRRERMPKIRKTIAGKMAESHLQVARVTNIDDADVTDLEELRASHKNDFQAEGTKLTLLPFVVRAVIAALKAHPVVNASLDMDNGEVLYKDYVNVGIAVDSDRGLVVPVIRNADGMSIVELAVAIDRLAEKIRSGDFDVGELRGGTFTVTNLGSVGGQYATPIVNYPESAVLLSGRSKPRPVVRDGKVVVRTILPLSLSYDHRIIDGAEAGRFLNDIIALLENPGRLLMR